MKKGFRPRLEALEERWVPATVKDVAGNLLISNQNGPLTVTVSTTVVGQVTVKDNGSAVTYSSVGSLIEITGSNLADGITFHGNATDYTGNLIVSGGNGADTVTLDGGGARPLRHHERQRHSVVELGADTNNLNGAIGGSLTYNDTYGNDTVVTTGATTVGGNASLTGLQNLTLTSPLTVKGSLTITNLSAGFPLNVTGAGALSVGTASNVFQSLTVTAAGGANVWHPTGAVTVTGNANFNLAGSSSNTFFMSAVGSSVGGNFYYQGGYGTNAVTIANTDFAGNATINTGGATTLTLAATTWTVAGNLTINEGNAANAAFTVGGLIAGNETITQGNGVNGTVTISTTPAGLFTYHGGNGTDSVDLEGLAGSVYAVYITFGTGTNTLAFDTANTGITFLGYVSGSGGTNTFTQGALDTIIQMSFINFP